MLTCLLVGLQTASHRAVNFDKLREIIQHPTENPLTPDKNPNPLYLFSTPTLFPNPPLIFEENLNSQRVALKPPGRSSEDGI
jgi:hypothetical protein